MAFKTRCYGMSDVGRARQQNEDNYIFVPNQGLYIVADGMGGHASGKLASALAVRHITDFVCVQSKSPDFELPHQKEDDATDDDAHLLTCAIRHANERIYIEACKDPSHEGMGTTVVAVRDLGDERLVLAHAGDSRIYRFRNATLSQVTDDHSLLNHLLKTGKLKQEEADSFPNKNVILRALGLKDDVTVETSVVSKRGGDVFLLCSDGLTDLVEDWVIAEVFDDGTDDLKKVCTTLIDLANKAGGKDNITVMILVIEES